MFADSASHPISQGSTFGVVFSHNFLRSSLFDLIRLCSGINLLYMYMWNVLSWINTRAGLETVSVCFCEL